MKTNNNRGAALLVVVGLVALLLISSVAFSILMTVERSASSNYRHSVQARQMLYAGLAQAIADIDANVGESRYPIWGDTNVLTTIHPPSGVTTNRSIQHLEDVLQSIDDTTVDVCQARPLSREAMKYIPRALYQSMETVKPESKAFKVGNETVGRYSYVVANVSGLLDANIVGSRNRWVGANAGEIQLLNGLPFDVVDTNKFVDDRDNFKRYESIKELAELATNGLSPTKLSNFETFSYARPDLQPDGVTPKVFIGDDPTDPRSADEELREKRAAIVSAFTSCGINSAMPEPLATPAEWAYRSLIDYVDTDSVPEGATEEERLARPASEDVPQIQSVALLSTYNCTDNSEDATRVDHVVNYKLWVGCTRPYLSTNSSASYTVVAEAYIQNVGTEDTWLPLLPWNHGDTITSSNTFSPFGIFGDSPQRLEFALNQCPTVTVDRASSPEIQCRIAVRVKVLNADNEVVDQVPVPWDGSRSTWVWFNYTRALGSHSTLDERHAIWSETLDPAINWIGTPNKGQWIPSEDASDGPTYNQSLCYLPVIAPASFGDLFSAGNAAWTSEFQTYLLKVSANEAGGCLTTFLMENSEALNWLNGPDGVNFPQPIVPDGVTVGSDNSSWDTSLSQKRHYVKNAALDSVGELGFLSIGRWMTINLYPHGHTNTYDLLPVKGFHPVLDYFSTRYPTNKVSRGLVSLGSQSPNVHASVLNQMPIDEWSGVTANRLGAIDATNFSQRLAASCWSATNLSDMGLLLRGAHANNVLAGTALASTGEFEREALIRNSAQLYTVRQQIYTIIVRADAMTFEYGGGAEGTVNELNRGTVLGSAQAVFQVWRDSEQDADGKHPCFVRLCKILSL